MILAKGSNGIAAVPLAKAPERCSYCVDRVSGPEQRRLSELGLVEGQQLCVLNRCRNNMVVKVGGCRLALARDMTDHVWVK